MGYLNLAFYHFVDLSDPVAWRDRLRERCLGHAFRGTILISSEGINAMLSGPEAELRALQRDLAAIQEFSRLEYKESWSSEIAFPRMLVKVKKEIIPLGLPEIRPHERTGQRLSPSELKRWLDECKDFTLLDTRNDYEVDYGTFDSALSLKLDHFREFPERLAELTTNSSPDARERPLVMFCTGGIRCEKASVVALQQGYKEVYQLDGGILKYFEECGGEHYEGQCFVFDRRIAVGTDLAETVPMPGPVS